MIIFLSHASEDAKLAQQIQAEIEARLPHPGNTAPIVIWRD